jgi:hypothetical protein
LTPVFSVFQSSPFLKISSRNEPLIENAASLPKELR